MSTAAQNDLPPGNFEPVGKATQRPSIEAGQFARLLAAADLREEDLEIARGVEASLRTTGAMPFPWSAQNERFLRGHPESAWIDYIVYRCKFHLFPRQRRVADFPIYLLLEPASACNLGCRMCFQVDRSFTRKPFMGVMDLGLYRDLIDQAVAGGTRALTLASRGEPLLHPRLAEMLDYAAGKFLELKLNTNATKLTERLSHAILAAGVDLLVFSADAHTKELYEEIRVGGDFDEVLSNIRLFHDIRARHYPGSGTATRISGVACDPRQDAQAFHAFWSGIVDEVGYVPALERWNTYDNPPLPDLDAPCHYLWERLYVWWDGSCNPCDADYKSLLALGDARKASLHEIWHGPAYRRLRRSHAEGRRHGIVPCDRCGI